MKEDHIYDLMGKYLAHEINEEENKIFQKWLHESRDNLEEFEKHKRVWEDSTLSFQSPEAEIIFKHILNKIDDDQAISISDNRNTGKSSPGSKLLIFARIAASLLIIASFLYVLISNLQKEDEKQIAAGTILKKNIAGQKSKIYLPDGSEVWLNAETSLSYPEQFLSDTREVILEGEAFFNVVKNPEKPFIVKSGDVSTIVLGTSFNVRAFEDEALIYIALKSGKVKIEIAQKTNNETVYLEPGIGLKYNRTNHIAKTEEFDEEQLLSWKDGIIVFQDADLDEIISTLSRWYGVKFTVKNYPTEKWTYTGSFDNEILDNVLKGIEFTEGFTHNFNENKEVIIKF